jgi:hypothetical protein
VITRICGLAGASALRVGLQGRKRSGRRGTRGPKSVRAVCEIALPPEAAAVGHQTQYPHPVADGPHSSVGGFGPASAGAYGDV